MGIFCGCKSGKASWRGRPSGGNLGGCNDNGYRRGGFIPEAQGKLREMAFIDIPGLGIIIEGMVGRSGTFGKGLGPFMLPRP